MRMLPKTVCKQASCPYRLRYDFAVLEVKLYLASSHDDYQIRLRSVYSTGFVGSHNKTYHV